MDTLYKIISVIFGIALSLVTCTIFINSYVILLLYNVMKFIAFYAFSILFKKTIRVSSYSAANINYDVGVAKYLTFFGWYKPYCSAYFTTKTIFKKQSRKDFLKKLGYGGWFFTLLNIMLILTFGLGKIYFEYAYILYRRCYNSLRSRSNLKTTTFKLQFSSLLILEIQSLKKLNLENVIIPDDL